MRPMIYWMTLLGLLGGGLQASATTLTQLTAQHRAGQTFLLWATPPGAGWRYRVYRSSSPISDLAALNSATLAGSVGDSTWKDRRLSQLRGQTFAYRLDSLGTELASTQGVCVVTPAANRVSYYAVTAQAGLAAEDRSVALGSNSLLTPIIESLAVTRPVHQRTLSSGNLLFDVYTTFANPEDTPLVPAMTTTHGIAFDHAVVRGTPGGPLHMRPHARGGSFLNVLGGSGEPGEWRVALDDHLYRSTDRNSFWYGYHPAYDLEVATPLTPLVGVVRDYTLNRILHTFAWARRELPVDTTRVIASGGSMGAIGSLRLAFAAGAWLAGIHLIVPKFDFSFTSDPNPANAWNAGSPERVIGDHLWGAIATGLASDDGMPVYERLNDGILAARAEHPGIPPIIAFNGRQDVVVGWAEKIGYYAASQDHRQGGTYFWDMRNHSGDGAGWSPMESTRRLYRLRTDRSYPAFSNASSDASPGDGAVASGDSLGTINGHLDWDTLLVDQPDGWACIVLRRDLTSRWGSVPAPASITTDITPRRLQHFAPSPGEWLLWEVRRVNDNVLTMSGSALVDGLGLVTVPQAAITGAGVRVAILRPSALSTSSPDGESRLRMRPLRNPARGTLQMALVARPGMELHAGLHDLMGREVRSFDSAMLGGGAGGLNWDVSQLPAGLYFIRIQQGDQSIVARVTLLR